MPCRVCPFFMRAEARTQDQEALRGEGKFREMTKKGEGEGVKVRKKL